MARSGLVWFEWVNGRSMLINGWSIPVVRDGVADDISCLKDHWHVSLWRRMDLTHEILRRRVIVHSAVVGGKISRATSAEGGESWVGVHFFKIRGIRYPNCHWTTAGSLGPRRSNIRHPLAMKFQDLARLRVASLMVVLVFKMSSKSISNNN